MWHSDNNQMTLNKRFFRFFGSCLMLIRLHKSTSLRWSSALLRLCSTEHLRFSSNSFQYTARVVEERQTAVWNRKEFVTCRRAETCMSKGTITFNQKFSNGSLFMARSRGLEIGTGGATPSEGGMTLYLKAGPDGVSVGDCPFAHFVRMVLEEKGLDYQLRPCGSNDDKPDWLKEHYEGKMPALRHRSECYVESDVIAQYLDFFFEPDSLVAKKKFMSEANNVLDGFFPAFAKYTKHTPDGDDDDNELKSNLVSKLGNLEDHLNREERTGAWFVGDGTQFTLTDCSLAPKLYQMKTCLEEFKGNPIDFPSQFPNLSKYMDGVMSRPSFEKTVYPKEYVIWGWGNARSKM